MALAMAVAVAVVVISVQVLIRVFSSVVVVVMMMDPARNETAFIHPLIVDIKLLSGIFLLMMRVLRRNLPH